MERCVIIMKKKFLCFAILSIMVLNCVGCESNKKSKEAVTHETIAYAVKQSGTCNVSIEPKIELLAVVQYIADDPTILRKNLSEDDQKYSDDISKYFSKYKDEPVVSLYKEMMKNGFSYSTPPETMLYVDNNLKLLNNLTLPQIAITSSGGKETLLKFFDLLADFRKKTKFDEFYISHTNFYNNIVSNVKNRIDKIGCIEALINYYGYKQNSYNFIIEPLSIGGYAARVPSKDGKFDLYDFMVIPEDDKEFFQLVIHEFGHSYVNPLTEQNINEVNKYKNLFTDIKEDMSKQQYGSWDYCVNEHIIRAVAYRALYSSYGANVSQDYINRDTANKFIYIEEISEKLKEYESNRDKYPTFNDFYPRLLDGFKDLSNKEPTN